MALMAKLNGMAAINAGALRNGGSYQAGVMQPKQWLWRALMAFSASMA